MIKDSSVKLDSIVRSTQRIIEISDAERIFKESKEPNPKDV